MNCKRELHALQRCSPHAGGGAPKGRRRHFFSTVVLVSDGKRLDKVCEGHQNILVRSQRKQKNGRSVTFSATGGKDMPNMFVLCGEKGCAARSAPRLPTPVALNSNSFQPGSCSSARATTCPTGNRSAAWQQGGDLCCHLPFQAWAPPSPAVLRGNE